MLSLCCAGAKMLIAVHSSRMQSSKEVSQHSRRLLVKGYPMQPAQVLRKGNHILLFAA